MYVAGQAYVRRSGERRREGCCPFGLSGIDISRVTAEVFGGSPRNPRGGREQLVTEMLEKWRKLRQN